MKRLLSLALWMFAFGTRGLIGSPLPGLDFVAPSVPNRFLDVGVRRNGMVVVDLGSTNRGFFGTNSFGGWLRIGNGPVASQSVTTSGGRSWPTSNSDIVDLDSISVVPGEYDIHVSVQTINTSTNGVYSVMCGVSSTLGNTAVGLILAKNSAAAPHNSTNGAQDSCEVMSYRVKVAGTAAVNFFLKAQALSSGSYSGLAYNSRISAVSVN